MKDRVPSLDGLRAYAVAFVLLGHLGTLGKAPEFFTRYAHFGVEVFFVISGFIITRLLLRERDRDGAISLGDFYRRRFFRIVPAAYLYITCAVAIHFSMFRPADIASALTFTSNFDAHKPNVIGHLWSLGIEEQFYILWPLLLIIFFRFRLAVLVVALLLSPLTRCDSLAIGCLGAILYERLTLQSRWYLLCGPLALFLSWPLWRGHTLWPIAHLCLGAFIIHATHNRYFLLNAAPIAWVGTISYGIYLWQPLFLVPRYIPFAPLWILGAAALSWYALESPLIRWRQKKSHGWQRRTTVVGDIGSV